MIKEFLDKAATAYYAGTPLISDEEFDALAEHFKYAQLGDPLAGEVKHFYKLYSLQKVHDGEEWPEVANMIVTPKIDGAAIAVTYIQGTLLRIATRGNGVVGQDVTEKVKHLVPNEILSMDPIVQVNCEIAAPKSIPNARNYAAGALNLKDIAEVKKRNLKVFAYDFEYDRDGQVFYEYSDKLERLKAWGFSIVTDDIEQLYPTDGKVVRENNLKLYYDAGYTSKHPRAAFAVKPKATAVTTTLLDVQWQLGRSGVVSPVAILEPVMIGEAEVSRATLHNMDYIEALGLEIGCTVELIRSGEIIPRIVRRVNYESNIQISD